MKVGGGGAKQGAKLPLWWVSVLEDHLYSVILIVLYLSSLGVRTDSIALLLFPVACPPLLLFLFLSPLQKGWHLICSSALVPSSLPLPFFSPLLSGAKGNSATEAKRYFLSRWELNPDLPRSAWARSGTS